TKHASLPSLMRQASWPAIMGPSFVPALGIPRAGSSPVQSGGGSRLLAFTTRTPPPTPVLDMPRDVDDSSATLSRGDDRSEPRAGGDNDVGENARDRGHGGDRRAG